ncbi:Piwi domain-containing protein [Lactifluus subvellereus]|nr:Piwi domain-containing protein [Lactifluus subvellereus]
MARNYQIIDALQTQVEGRLSAQPGAYDGRKNLFTSFDLEFESGAREYVVPMGTPSSTGERSRGPEEFKVRLTHVASINPELLKRFVRGEQNHDDMVLTAIMALNVVIRMGPSQRYPFRGRSFFTDRETRDIGGGIVLWRGYFQSVRPAIDRMLVNIDISTGPMYKPGTLINLALEFLRMAGEPNALAPRRGFPERERMRLQQFVSGLKVTTPHNEHNPGRQRLVKKLSRESARDLSFEVADGQSITVAQYFQERLNRPLRFPDVICVELSTGALIPLELCDVPPGQIIRKQMTPDAIKSILGFSSMHPRERHRSIRDGLSVLEYGQSEYIRQFGMTIDDDELLDIDARVIKAPRLKYNPESKQPNVVLKTGNSTWNLIDKLMYKPATIDNWVVLIYERQGRCRREVANEMVANLVKGCEAVGISINHQPAVMRWESGQANIGRQLRAACEECQRFSKSLPTLIVVVLPDGGNDIYTAVKHFGDVSDGIATQCMKSSKCLRAKAQYFANITLKINMKLGGINVVPEPQDVSFLTDPANPMMVMGRSRQMTYDYAYPYSGCQHAAKYVSRMSVQKTLREVIEDLEGMCVGEMGKLPKRILFYRDGVSEGEFKTIITEELKAIRSACAKLDFDPTITLVVVGKKHKVVFFPRQANADQGGNSTAGLIDRSGNCPAGMVVDTKITSPVEFDYYLLSHNGILGTSKPAHYNVLFDENKFTADGLQSLSFALCHVYARCTRSVSVPAPVYYAHNVCTRAKNHYEPQQSRTMFGSEIATETTDTGGTTSANEYERGFRQTHERMAKTMYFC